MASSTTSLRRAGIALALGLATMGGPAADAQTGLAGTWDGIVTTSGVEVPFQFEISGEGDALGGALFNGEQRIVATGGQATPSEVVLRFDQYGARLELQRTADGLSGQYRRARGEPLPFSARRATPAQPAPGAPAVGGVWILQAKSSKGEAAWRFIARQDGGTLQATILRIDGDTGTLTGRWTGDRFVLGHFSGGRPLRLEVTPQRDGTLALSLNGQPALAAARASDAAAAALGAPTDAGHHTRMKDPAEPLRFAFPDVDGHLVSNTDARFRGKVLLVNVSGSWCPNCHDEAPFLASLYRRYRGLGLEVVTLSFEEAAQLADPARLKAFNATYGIEHTVLLPGEPDQLNDKLPQAENLNAFPTTFLVGRDGRVRGVHAGFPSAGSGEFYDAAIRDITGTIERLLAEKESR